MDSVTLDVCTSLPIESIMPFVLLNGQTAKVKYSFTPNISNTVRPHQWSAQTFKTTSDENGKREYQKYYMRIYRASDVEKENYRNLLHDVLKLGFECDGLRKQINESDKTGLPVETKADKLVMTLIVKTDHPEDWLNAVTVKPKEKVLQPLIPFYGRFAKEFHQKYRSQVALKSVEEKVRHYQTFSYEELENEKKVLQSHKNQCLILRIYQERRKAQKVLENRFGHPDAAINLKMLEQWCKTLETREQLWLNAMFTLQDEGFRFFEAKLAADNLAFPLGEPEDPYIYYDDFPRHLSALKVWDHQRIVEWKKGEAEDIAIKSGLWLENWRQEREKERKEKLVIKQLREWLTWFIENGYDEADLAAKCIEAKYDERATRLSFEVYKELKAEGVKPKILRMRIVEDQQELDTEWLRCMARQSGQPRDRGPEPVEEFDKAVEHCTFITFKGTGKQPSPATFEKAKKFWQPGYWYEHDSNEVTDDE